MFVLPRIRRIITKKNLPTILLIGVFLAGLTLLLYPTISNYWNSFTQTHLIGDYEHAVEDLSEDEYNNMLEAARSYNQELMKNSHRFEPTEKEHLHYQELLDPGKTGVMAVIEIPSIKCTLPVYHGVEKEVLQSGAGHIEGSSLPVGGKSTHCVLSGHRGLPRAQLFTKLDKLREGDIFVLRVLDRTLTYEVDQIKIVLPEETQDLEIQEGKDLCTLVTCTPYGINTHRLLVRGHRVPNRSDDLRITAEAIQISTYLIASVLASVILVLLMILLFVSSRVNHRGLLQELNWHIGLVLEKLVNYWKTLLQRIRKR